MKTIAVIVFAQFLIGEGIVIFKNMEKKKRKRIIGSVSRVDLRDNCIDHLSESDYYDSVDHGLGQAVMDLVQCTTRLAYVSSNKVSDCSNNPRQHYRDDGREKEAYDSVSEAKSVAAYWWGRNEDMRVYKCSYCGKYHIGHLQGEGPSTAYSFYKGGEALGHIIELGFLFNELFSDDDGQYVLPYEA